MLLFLICLVIAFIGLSLLEIYKIHKLDIIKKIDNKVLSWIISIIPILFIILLMKFDIFNSLIIVIYSLIIWYLFDFTIYIFQKMYKNKISNNFSFIFGTIISIVYLVNAYNLANNVVGTKYEIYTDKDIGMDKFRIIQISDSHIGATMNGDKFINYMENINELNPDIVVITGDFIDDDTKKDDMIKACIGLSKLKTKYGVYFVYGNHDKGYFTYRGYDDELFRQELNKNGVMILEDQIYDITDNISIIGRKDKSDKTRKSIYELANNIDSSKYIIDLNHQPNDYENEKNTNIDLVLSGHTHGGQFFPLGPLGTLIGANDNYYGLKKINNTNFIVNSGIADWAFKFKTGAISEYGIIDIIRK